MKIKRYFKLSINNNVNYNIFYKVLIGNKIYIFKVYYKNDVYYVYVKFFVFIYYIIV